MASNAELAQNAMTDLQKYTNPNAATVQAMVKSYGLVMRKPDTRLVACGDPAELETVKRNFMRKKLGMTDGDAALDAMLADVCGMMSATNQKSRLTFYYLVAEKAGKLGVFG